MKFKNLILIILFIFVLCQGIEFPQDKKAEKIIKNQYGFDSLFIFGSVPNSIAVVGDLQRTSILGRLLGNEQNDYERHKIINSIDSLHPGLLVILGDIVFQGSDSDMWKDFDSLIFPINRDSIHTSAVIGNHDYYFNSRKGLKNFSERFPRFKYAHWYTQIYDSLALIFLDSNLEYYSAEEKQNQINWYSNLINDYDSTSSIKGIFVFMHHPPYSNKIITGDNPVVEKAFVPQFINTKKTLALITGHAHTYERFKINKKMFIISGGGGGPRVEVNQGEGTHKDLYDGDKVRPFNYLILQIKNSGVSISVIGLDKDSSDFFTMEKFLLPYSK